MKIAGNSNSHTTNKQLMHILIFSFPGKSDHNNEKSRQ